MNGKEIVTRWQYGGTPTYDRLARLIDEEMEQLRAENERLKELEDTASSCLVEANTTENQLRAENARLVRQVRIVGEELGKVCVENEKLKTALVDYHVAQFIGKTL